MDYWDFPNLPIEGERVELIPLVPAHAAALAPALLEPGTWFYDQRGVRAPADLEAQIERNLRAREARERYTWTMRLRGSGELVGMTALIGPQRDHRAVEIGGTWIARKWQRTFVNTEVKRLLLAHCFERLGCARVSFKVDVENQNSQRAMSRLGARFEGVMRHGWVLSEGRDRRDLQVFSILEAEWPGIREKLTSRLNAG